MSRDDKPGAVIDIRQGEAVSDARRHERREAKARALKQRFAKARKSAAFKTGAAGESKSRAAERLKKLFKNPGRNSR